MASDGGPWLHSHRALCGRARPAMMASGCGRSSMVERQLPNRTHFLVFSIDYIIPGSFLARHFRISGDKTSNSMVSYKYDDEAHIDEARDVVFCWLRDEKTGDRIRVEATREFIADRSDMNLELFLQKASSNFGKAVFAGVH
jgi:hypothetical protein